MMTDKYNAKSDKKSLHMLRKMYKQTLLDGNFQRWGGVHRGSGWSMKNGKSYITNFLQGGTFNNIINVDVKAALTYCQDIKCHKSINYFSEVINKGFEFISIDGNNSASFLSEFISDNDELKIKHANYVKPVAFSKLSEDEKEDIKYTEKINVIILRDITVDQMCDLFRFLNTQTKLNAQEWRQARVSELSQAIRDIGNLNRSFFTHFLYNKEADLDKRSHEELIAVMALKLSANFSTTHAQKSSLDSFYEGTESLNDDVIRDLGKIFNVCERITDTLDKPLQRKFIKGQVMNLFDVIHIICNEEKYNILDAEAFLEWFVQKDADYRLASGSVTESEQESKSYTYWSKFYQVKNSWTNVRNLFRCTFAKEVEDLVEKGVVKARRSKKDSFTFEQKLQLQQLQNYKTRNGDTIRALDLYLGKFEADHVKSVSDGGNTTLENGELMTVVENRQKGSQSNQPHFNFQT